MSENETDGRAGGGGNSALSKPPDLDYPVETASKTPLESLSRRTESDDPDKTPGTPLQRLFWFGVLWLAGVAAVSLVAFLIRSVIS